jgi:hypothetical protein
MQTMFLSMLLDSGENYEPEGWGGAGRRWREVDCAGGTNASDYRCHGRTGRGGGGGGDKHEEKAEKAEVIAGKDVARNLFPSPTPFLAIFVPLARASEEEEGLSLWPSLRAIGSSRCSHSPLFPRWN